MKCQFFFNSLTIIKSAPALRLFYIHFPVTFQPEWYATTLVTGYNSTKT